MSEEKPVKKAVLKCDISDISDMRRQWGPPWGSFYVSEEKLREWQKEIVEKSRKLFEESRIPAGTIFYCFLTQFDGQIYTSWRTEDYKYSFDICESGDIEENYLTNIEDLQLEE
jgi:hypothetical protein